MAAVHHFEMPYEPAQTRCAWLLWFKDAAAALGLVAFIASCFVLTDALAGLFV